jgi:hypothetical protein
VVRYIADISMADEIFEGRFTILIIENTKEECSEDPA